ncbi:hypothetical protein [Alicyclobacillus ferrooxydans]|uniref:Uncharacterized protein n=1 Tax=Alicyclobacillus ferrooxydans TaxID=471514 RepID=A0A0P9D8S3_9BACL|nr:hypothetical protein [Alicyclobacillus ferrooxydans]KPV45799.1 hypothetical protein AN477_00015 [Alicyclobacillus ferrooxydans]
MQIEYYKYTVVNLNDQRELMAAAPPEMFAEEVGALLEIIGHGPTNIVIYSHQDGGLYRPKTNADLSITDNVFFRLDGSNFEPRPTMSAAESLELGQRIASAYVVLRKKFVYLKMKKWGSVKPETQQELNELSHKLSIVENAIVGTGEMEAVFDLWLRKQFSPEKCAMELHMGKSTWYRRCRAVARHIAFHLTERLSPSALRELLQDAGKMEDWMSLFEYLDETNT